MCLMAALTGMRTGSYTKARDSPKSLTPESKAMWHESGPLRFEHTGFFLTHDGVGLQLTFTHWKNSIRADLARRDHIRVLTFLPFKSRNFYLDLPSLLFALAYHRDLPHKNFATFSQPGRANDQPLSQRMLICTPSLSSCPI
jgi:hypothetical protein